ncbi:hypothetical protein ACI2KV_21680 [Micromonospora chokoriensis]
MKNLQGADPVGPLPAAFGSPVDTLQEDVTMPRRLQQRRMPAGRVSLSGRGESAPEKHDFLVQFVGPILAGVPILMAGAKVLLVANGNEATLGALLSTLNIPAVLLSVYLYLLPRMLIVLPGAFLIYKYGVLGDVASIEERRRSGFILLPLVGTGFLLAPASVADIVTQAILALIYFVIAFTHFLPTLAQTTLSLGGLFRLGSLWAWLLKNIRLVAITYTAFVLIIAPLTRNPSQDMWLPAVTVEEEGGFIGTGWILEESEQATKLLLPDSTVTRIPSSEIIRIEFCQRGSGRRPLVLLLLTRGPGNQAECIRLAG